MSVHENLIEISKSLENLEETGIYDVEKIQLFIETFDKSTRIFLLSSS